MRSNSKSLSSVKPSSKQLPQLSDKSPLANRQWREQTKSDQTPRRSLSVRSKQAEEAQQAPCSQVQKVLAKSLCNSAAAHYWGLNL